MDLNSTPSMRKNADKMRAYALETLKEVRWRMTQPMLDTPEDAAALEHIDAAIAAYAAVPVTPPKPPLTCNCGYGDEGKPWHHVPACGRFTALVRA